MFDLDEVAARGWRGLASECGGCVALLHGTEIHVGFTRKGVITRRSVRKFLGPLLEELGFLTTRCPAADEHTSQFLTRLGFQKTWSDDQFHYYILPALPFTKG